MIWSILKFLLFRPAGLMIMGVLVMGAGAFVTFHAYQELPERSALKQVSGVLDSAVKITRRRSGSVKYRLEITSAGGEQVKLTLPEREISEQQVTSLLGRPVVALYSGSRSVWELSSGTTKIIEYRQTLQRRQELQALEAELGPYVGGGGLLVSLLGGFWMLRRRRVAEAAA